MHRISLAWRPWALLLWLALPAGADPLPVVRVGVMENRPIVFQAADGRYQGLALDVLEAVAKAEGWRLVYQPCDWSRCLKRLEAAELELLVGIAWSEERIRRFDFNRVPLLGNWGVVYRQPGAAVGSLLALEQQRLALVPDSIHGQAMVGLLKRFKIEWTEVAAPDYSAAMVAVAEDRADAAVVSRVFSILNADRHGLVDTGIVFNPIHIHYAGPQGRAGPLLAAIDRHLAAYREDADSLYYTSLNRWLASPQRLTLPGWLPWALAGVGVLLLCLLSVGLLSRHQVRVRTAQLLEQSQHLEREVAERCRAEENLNRLAFYDSLTGLPNRVLFQDRLNQACAEAHRHGGKVALMFLDIDRFKAVNDTYGHGVGDQLLCALTARLKPCIREVDTFSRMGGDELTVLVTDVAGPDDPARLAERLIDTCRAPFRLSGVELVQTLSMGIALYPDDANQPSELLHLADAAMYQAKARGGGRYCFHHGEYNRLVLERLGLESELGRALATGSLQLHYQPVVQLTGQRIVGVRALLRWEHPTYGLVAPEAIMQVAEQAGLAGELGAWMLDRACRQTRMLRDASGLAIHLAINLTVQSFTDSELTSMVAQALRDSELSAAELELEITEQLLQENGLEAAPILESLKSLGVTLAVNDFGTAQCSLVQLKHLPLDVLKIAPCLISKLPDDRDDSRIISTLIGVAHIFGLRVMAEGIETAAQRNWLQAQHCDLGQGRYFCEPRSAENLVEVLKTGFPSQGWLRGVV